jgi:hypothetical protein
MKSLLEIVHTVFADGVPHDLSGGPAIFGDADEARRFGAPSPAWVK